MKKGTLISQNSFFFSVGERIRTPDLLVRSQTLYPAELNAHLYRVLNCVAQQQNQVYIRKNNMSSVKMKKVQKILTSFLNGAMKAGLLVLIRDKDRSDSIW